MVKDTHLRMFMDAEGYFPIECFAQFPSVERIIGGDTRILYEAAKFSEKIELKKNKIRPSYYDTKEFALPKEVREFKMQQAKKAAEAKKREEEEEEKKKEEAATTTTKTEDKKDE